MRTIVHRGWFVLAAAVGMALAVQAPAAAKSLKEHLGELSGGAGPDFSGGTVAAGVTAGDLDLLGPAVQQLAIRGTDFPVTSTVPGFAYVYNPQLQVLERSTQLGPVFEERAETLGAGRFQFGASYLFADLDEVGGRGFGSSRSAVFIQPNPSLPGALAITEDVNFSEFHLETHVLNTYATYGITDRWDVNLLVPLIYNDMRVRATRQFSSFDGSTITPLTALTPRRTDATSFGVGDVLVRTKYRFIDAGSFSLAGALSLRTPTGEEDDFSGLGDFTVTPTAVLSVPIGRHSLHATGGIEANVDDLDRSRAHYTAGASFQLLEQLAFLVDVLGSYAFVDDEIHLSGPTAVIKSVNGLHLGDDINALVVPRTDLIDVATGLKATVGPNVVLYAGVIVPVNDQGLRANIIPTGGAQFGF